MSRVRADFLLLLTALIWGATFLAQKTAMDAVGPYTFTGLRFTLSLAIIMPLLHRERRRAAAPLVSPKAGTWLLCLASAFTIGVLVQQIGIMQTSVINAGFLTGLYVIFTPMVSLLVFRITPNPIVWLAAPLCIFGVWLLGNGALTPLQAGDFLVMAAALCFALHIVLVGYVLSHGVRPFTIIAAQYAVCALFGLTLAFMFEEFNSEAIVAAFPQILFAGVVSGGIAFTLQVVAQQYTPASDAAIILSGEALFAALAGVLFLGDRLHAVGWAGCALIFLGILLVELYPLLQRRRRVKPR